MDLLKDETTVRLDEMTSLADETFAFYEDLIGEIEDDAFGKLVSKHVREQQALMQSIFRARQSHGELPQAGDVERGHLFAVAASVRHLFAEDDSSVIDRLGQANKKLREAAVAANEKEPPETERDLIRQLIASCDSLNTMLHEHAPQD